MADRSGVAITTDDDGSPRLAFLNEFNAADVFIDRHVAEGRGSKVAIRGVDGDVTYASLTENVNRFGNALRSLKLKTGDRVLMILADCPEFFYLFWGAVKRRIVPVPINTLLRAHDFAGIIRHSECAAVFYSREFASEVKAGVDLAKRHDLTVLDVEVLFERACGQSAQLASLPGSADDDCFWLYSSGTTGEPKGVVHAHASLAVVCHLFSERVLGAHADDVIFSVPRLSFSYGIGIAMATPLWFGATTILDRRRQTPDTIREIFRRFSPTVFAAVPSAYAKLLAEADFSGDELSKLRRCLSGGEATPPDLLRRWQTLCGLPILEVIGSTEAGFIYIAMPPDNVHPGTTGKPVPGYSVRIVDGAGKDVPDHVAGRLLVCGQGVMRRYWKNPQKTASALVGSWFDTGDVFFRDADGYYVFCGRADDMFKSGARWISPFEVESAITRHPAVLEAAVVERADDCGLVKPEAWIVLSGGHKASDEIADEIRAVCKRELAPYKYPYWIRFIDELPKTATGKVQRYMLRNNPTAIQKQWNNAYAKD